MPPCKQLFSFAELISLCVAYSQRKTISAEDREEKQQKKNKEREDDEED